MASVKKRAGYGYEVRYVDPATGRRPSKTFELKKDADAYRRKVEREIEDGEHISPHLRRTFRQAAAAYIEHLQTRLTDKAIGRSHFQRDRNAIMKWAVPIVGGLALKDMRADDALKVYRAMVAAKLSPDTLKGYMVANKVMEDWARSRTRRWTTGSAFADAMAEVRPPAADPVRTFTPEQVATLLREAAIRPYNGEQRMAAMLHCFVGLAALGGLRVGEIMALARDDVNA